ncbi:MAG: 3-methyl-2-oxobutanoate hydroxymethyltransferase [Verrucomicrobiota bacterium]
MNVSPDAPAGLTAYGIALGSNVGDRLSHLHAALGALASLGELTAVSPAYQTAPVDCQADAPAFLNAVAELHSALEPVALLQALRGIERGLGRPDRRPQNSPRPIDLDILYAGPRVVQEDSLTVPHPRLHLRRFVLEPLAAIRPALILPGFSVNVRTLLDQLVSGEPPLLRYADLAGAGMPENLAGKWAALMALKPAGRQVVCLTAGDYATARLLDEGGVDLILAGDSLGMVLLGYQDTVDVTLAEMVHHTRAVRRGVKRAPVLGDLPFHTYTTPEQAVASARALVQAGADGVKLEGGVTMLPQIKAILAAGIPVVGHIGMLPQSVREEGGYKKKGKTEADAARLLADAVALDEAGVVAMVLEGVVPAVAADISRAVSCPTIGIGAGKDCDGQVLVTADLVGAFPWFRPPFAQARGDVAGVIRQAVVEFSESVRE